MSRIVEVIVEVDDSGALVLPAKWLHAEPHTRYLVERVGDAVWLRPEHEKPFWETATPEQRAAAWLEWITAAPQHQGPPIPDEALRRENLYD